MRAKGQSEGLLDSPVLPCFFFAPIFIHLLLPFYWPHHRHSMRATDWMRRWVGVRREPSALCVFLSFSFGSRRSRRGFRHGANGPPLPVITFSPCFAGIGLPNHHPWPTPAPSPSLVPVLKCLFLMPRLVCVLKLSTLRCILRLVADPFGQDASIWGEKQHWTIPSRIGVSESLN